MKRSEIAKLETPESTETWKPVPHIELLETMTRVLRKEGIWVEQEQFGIGRKGLLMFWVSKLKFTTGSPFGNDGTATLGIRQALNKTMSIQICAGFTVFVCDNLVFRGDMIALRRKHTSGLDLEAEITEAVGKLRDHFGILNDEMQTLKKTSISDEKAKAVMFDIFSKGIMPKKFMEEVRNNFENPIHPEFQARSMWSLHNAFTKSAKKMPITTRFRATQEIGKYFGLTTR
jgi:hypothetical protein